MALERSLIAIRQPERSAAVPDGIVLATVIFNHKNGLLEDRTINDFVFICPIGASSESENLIMESRIKEFYNTAPSGSPAVNTYLSGALDRFPSRAEIRFYDITAHLDGSRHGSPYRSHLWTLGGSPTGVSMPNEIACVLSFRADYGNQPEFGPGLGPHGGKERPRARRRGRLYLGPLDDQVATYDTTTFRTYVQPAMASSATKSAKRLMDYTDVKWGVWSRVDGNALPVTSAWMDDAFDVQRRRGEAPLARTTVVHA